jgi:A/G-specific adenine glycosylase
MNKTAITPKQFQRQILRWFAQFGRKTLPWQQAKTPYRVWVSEIMLQQTQVSAVIGYFERFMQRFPCVELLAAASEDEVLHLWTGLGYYSRARNLHKSAQYIVNHYQGQLPPDNELLQQLPGIGRSTAGAILALAFNQPAAILDGNVKRVLTRFYGITTWSGEKSTHDLLWLKAQALTPKAAVAEYTQAMMDMGATVCIRGKPLCLLCPLQQQCMAYQQGLTKTIPVPKPKKILPTRQVSMLILTKPNAVLLEKRNYAGVWQNLWSLPEVVGLLDLTAIKNVCLTRFASKVKSVQMGEIFRHTFSHYHLDIQPVYIVVKQPQSIIMADDLSIWYNLKDSPKLGLPAPIKKLLREMV